MACQATINIAYSPLYLHYTLGTIASCSQSALHPCHPNTRIALTVAVHQEQDAPCGSRILKLSANTIRNTVAIRSRMRNIRLHCIYAIPQQILPKQIPKVPRTSKYVLPSSIPQTHTLVHHNLAVEKPFVWPRSARSGWSLWRRRGGLQCLSHRFRLIRHVLHPRRSTEGFRC
jgi:hypothetical protein